MNRRRIEMQTLIESTSVVALKEELRGTVICPGDAGYEAARRVYNAMIDRHPQIIIRCTDAADVIAAVRFARESGLPLAVRGGGHNGGGLGTCDEGVVIDLSPMKGIRVDPQARTALVEGGCLLRDLDHATHAFGLATPTGINSTTGIGGLTLGGGFGHLTRRYGLTVDNLLAVDMVLADGRFVTASTEQNADLFWAVRGGGGNFGIVTAFLFRLHPVETVVAGQTLWPLERAAEALCFYRDFLSQAPDELSGIFAISTVPPWPRFPEHLHLKPVCGVTWCYAGPEQHAEELFAPVRAFGSPVLHSLASLPFPKLQQATDALYPAGLQWYWRAHYLTELTDGATTRIAQEGATLPTAHSRIQLFPIDGAASRVDPHEMAYNYREAKWSLVIVGVDPDPAKANLLKSWTVSTWAALQPFSAGGAYVNFMMEENQDRVVATYRDNYPRLAAIKAHYDPDNLFRINQNIRP
ncbi:MAG: FAD-binding oxidoreductase [Chloroflexi bacterium]|nr:FAD-binding oxidoreductase [Chloroflexota bacterium]